MPPKKTTQKQPKTPKLSPTLLIILDGFGLADPNNPGNAITPKTAPNIFGYMEKYPSSTLKTYGHHVGLFKGQEGNSEAGHMNIGAGRIVKQDLVEISEAIANGTFFKNEAFKHALYHVKKYKTAVHVMGLLTDNNSAHAYPEHIYALLELFRREKIDKVFLHLFTDGRDSGPHQALSFLHDLRKEMKGTEKISTIMGRFFGMDRNKHWDRTQRAYEAMVLGKGCVATSAEDVISQSYNRNETDEFICATVIVEDNPSNPSGQVKPVATIKDNDAIFFFNARSDRARQITKAFVQQDFVKKNPGAFKRTKFPKNIRFVAMTDFGPDLPNIATAFPSCDLINTLPMLMQDRRQLYIAESEKYAHVSYFLNGGYADPIDGEERIRIPSVDVKSFDAKPEMSAQTITDEILRRLKLDMVDFCCVNFANADMVGHTGNFISAQKAVSVVDTQVGRLVTEFLKQRGQILIVADHGNAEEMQNRKTNEVMTEHSLNPVPCILVSKELKNLKLKNGILADVAPTVLKMMGLKKPGEMTGHSLY